MIDTTWFYAPPVAFSGERVELSEGESHHLRKVLRGGAGEEIVVVDGEGGCYTVRLEEAGPDRVVGRILEESREVGEPDYELTVALGIVKKRSRFETFLEKSVELGVRRIIPLITEYGEKQKIREDRAERIMTAAMKQTRRSRLPDLNDPRTIEDLTRETGADVQLVCHGGSRRTAHLAERLGAAEGGTIVTAVGPEGGFSDREIAQFHEQRWQLAHLGSRRLRTETAGIVAAATVQIVCETA